MVKSIQIAGVGGQGILVAADIIALAAMGSGFDVKKSEIHGMSQRGGSVLSAVKFGDKVSSPVITTGEADVLLAFEKLEALRQLHYLSDQGLLVVNDLQIDPLSVVAGNMEYPRDIKQQLENKINPENILLIDANKIALKAGNLRTMNVVLLGAISHKLPEISESSWKQAISQRVPQKFTEVNYRAFEMGKKS
jgi:indolepyruvate ferredoxin oxidoreductase, beta subunit